MSDQRASSGDPKGKSKYLSRDEKHQRKLEARGESAQCYVGASGSTNDGNKPSKKCKAAVFQALYQWFKETPYTNINKKNLALEEVVKKEAFHSHIRRLFEDAISRE
jgi:hypothetical protein